MRPLPTLLILGLLLTVALIAWRYATTVVRRRIGSGCASNWTAAAARDGEPDVGDDAPTCIDDAFRPITPGALGGCTDPDPGFEYPRNVVITEDLVRTTSPNVEAVSGVGMPCDTAGDAPGNLVGIATNRLNTYQVNPFKDFGAVDLGLSAVAILDEAVDYDTIVSNTRWQRINKSVSDLRAPPVVDFDRSNIPIGASPGSDAYFPSRDYYGAQTYVI